MQARAQGAGHISTRNSMVSVIRNKEAEEIQDRNCARHVGGGLDVIKCASRQRCGGEPCEKPSKAGAAMVMTKREGQSGSTIDDPGLVVVVILLPRGIMLPLATGVFSTGESGSSTGRTHGGEGGDLDAAEPMMTEKNG